MLRFYRTTMRVEVQGLEVQDFDLGALGFDRA